VSHRPTPPRRESFTYFTQAPTRWNDNDSYGHVNNVVYYSFFDTAVNQYLIEKGVLNIQSSPIVGFVLETRCRYFSPFGFPDRVAIGMKVSHIGNSSVGYEIALFRNDEEIASALGQFVHVYVDRSTNRPVTLPGDVRKVLEQLMPTPRPGDVKESKEIRGDRAISATTTGST
jgi:acyl-CoA thioester hydrolase